MKNRKAAEEFWIDIITRMSPGNLNIEMYTKLFAGLSDKEFDTLMQSPDGLPFYSPNLADTTMSVTDLLKVADGLGVKIFERLWLIDPVTGVKYLTPKKYMVLMVQVRRQSQHLSKKKSVVKDSTRTDSLTGQGTGDSAASSISLPEVMITQSLGHLKGIEELLKVRGGDTVAIQAASRSIRDTGNFTLKAMNELDSRPTSTKTVRSLLLGMHLENNL